MIKGVVGPKALTYKPEPAYTRIPPTNRRRIVPRSADKIRAKLAGSLAKGASDFTRSYFGRSLPGGYRIESTKDYAMLCVKGQGTGTVFPMGRDRDRQVLLGADYGERLIEAGTCTPKSGLILHRFTSGTLTLVSNDESDYYDQRCSAECSLDIDYDGPDVEFGLGYKLILPVLGLWPVRLAWTAADSYVVLDYVTEWYYVVQPMLLKISKGMKLLC